MFVLLHMGICVTAYQLTAIYLRYSERLDLTVVGSPVDSPLYTVGELSRAWHHYSPVPPASASSTTTA